MRLKGKLLSLFLVLVAGALGYLVMATELVYASDQRFVVIINPVRGNDFWQLKRQAPKDFVILQKRILQERNIKATWLLRPDVLFSPEMSDFFAKKKFRNDELGIFLEVTPSWAEHSEVRYVSKGSWSLASQVFLSGYNLDERKKLVRTAFNKFKETFGYYPKTVGAWHVDPYTASLVKQKYHIQAILVCTDQFSTDGYQIWGGWWGVPFYPSRENLLIPAANEKDKLGAVVLWWAARDPLNGYGPSVFDSTFSIQANDYLTYHHLGIDYFSKLADLYLFPQKGNFGQLTVGLENDNDIEKYGGEFEKQIKVLEEKGVAFVTASEFAAWYKRAFPHLSPSSQIGGQDPLGTGREAEWLMDIHRRIGLVKDKGDVWLVRDLRYYQPVWPDPYLVSKNLTHKLYWNVPPEIDSVRKIGKPHSWDLKLLSSRRAGRLFVSHWWVLTMVAVLVVLASFKLFKPPLVVAILILLGGGVLSLTMVRSGRLYSFGLGFWGPNGHDGVWHLALMQQVVRHLPPRNPVFAGTVLQNYHWGFDFLAGWTAKLLSLSFLDVYFRLFPLLLAVSIGFLSFYLGKTVTKHYWVGFWFAFLNYFAGSLGWVVTLLRNGTLGGESLFWSMQSISTLINPPYALSLVFLLVGFLFWIKMRKSNNWQSGVLLGIFLSVLTIIKVYASILIGLALFCWWLWQRFVKQEKNNFDFWVWVVSGTVSILFLLGVGALSHRSELVFHPFWFAHSMIESLDKLYFPRLAALRINLAAHWWSWKLPFLLLLELGLIVVFALGNMGTRILGGVEIIKKLATRKLEDFDVLVGFVLVFSFLFPLLFVQRGTTWNTIQFFYYFLFFSNFYFAVFLARLTEKRRWLVVVPLLFLTLPTTFASLRGYLGDIPPTALPYYELEGLSFLARRPEGIVLTFPYNKFAKNGLRPPLPLYLYESTSYVAAFTGQPVFLEDEMNLDITGYPWQERKAQTKQFFQSRDAIWGRGFLINNKIGYIYLVNEQKLPLSPGDLGVKMIFNNGQVKIYKVMR